MSLASSPMCRSDRPKLTEREEAAILQANPRIGVLGWGENRRYYAYLNGRAVEPFISHSIEEVAAQLIRF